MGLDNGIVLKMNNVDAKKAGCPFLDYSYNDNEVDICY